MPLDNFVFRLCDKHGVHFLKLIQMENVDKLPEDWRTEKAPMTLAEFKYVFIQYYTDGYIKKVGSAYYLTGEGRLFIENGGYTNLFSEQKEFKKLQKEQISSVIDTNRSVKKTNALQKWSLGVTLIIILIGCVVQISDWYVSKRQVELQTEQMNRDSIWHKIDSQTINGLSEKMNSIQKQLDNMHGSKSITIPLKITKRI
jgi:hypothetical protein